MKVEKTVTVNQDEVQEAVRTWLETKGYTTETMCLHIDAPTVGSFDPHDGPGSPGSIKYTCKVQCDEADCNA